MNSPIIAYRANMGVQTTAPFLNTYSLSFDGIDDYVGVSLTPSSSDVSVSFWIKAPSQGLGNVFGGRGIFQYMTGLSGTALRTNHYTVGWVTICTDVFDDQWHHIAVTFNNATSDLISYKDGVLNTTVNIPGFSTVSDHAINRIGAYGTGAPARYFEGIQDEISLFNSVLTQSDVTSIYNGGTPNDLSLLATPPTNWYRMGDNGSYKSPQLLIPSNENKDKVSNYSFAFDGLDDRVQLTSDFTASAEFTVSFWMKPTSISGNGNTFVVGTFPGNSNYIKLDQLSRIKMVIGGVAFLFLEDLYGSNNIVLNTWQNITITRDSSNGCRCFRNGTDFGYSGTPISKSNTLIFNSIGRAITNTFGFNGGLDEVAFWNTDETANVATIYNGGEPTTISGAVAHYRLGEEANFSGGVWTVPDAVGTNDGTSNAMTIEDRIGEAPNSSNNSVSFNMDLVDRTTDVPT